MADESKQPAVTDRAGMGRIFRAVQYVERLPRNDVKQGGRVVPSETPKIARSTSILTAASGDTNGFGNADIQYHDQAEGSHGVVSHSPALNVVVENPWPRAIGSGKRLIIAVISGKWTLMEADCS